jgi:hypothetical protein
MITLLTAPPLTKTVTKIRPILARQIPVMITTIVVIAVSFVELATPVPMVNV